MRGLQEAIDKLVEIQENSFPDAVQIIQQVGDQVADTARNEAPVRTGRLQGSIHSERTADGCRISADAPYAGYVNGGTRRMAARPFMTNALLDAQEKIVQKISERVEQH